MHRCRTRWRELLGADLHGSGQCTRAGWARADFQADGTHPSQTGERKVGTLLLNYFLASPYASCWISPGRVC